MITFPNAKINIGLQVLNRRGDGYHNLETVFYPIKLHDVLEVVEARETRFIPSGLLIPGEAGNNLCLKAYQLLQRAYNLPPVQIYLHKTIPIGAGLGGGSADAAFILTTLNRMFKLNLGEAQLMAFALELGADCSFFIRNTPVLATGIGNLFQDVNLDLSAYRLVLVNPGIHVATAEAYRAVNLNPVSRQLAQAIAAPIETWRKSVVNDFEAAVFPQYPAIAALKNQLYEAGAVFATMSGSGSSVYGLFKEDVELKGIDPSYGVFYVD